MTFDKYLEMAARHLQLPKDHEMVFQLAVEWMRIDTERRVRRSREAVTA